MPGPLCDRLAGLARELEAVVVGSLFERVRDGVCFNTAVVLERDGTLLGRSRKMHIPMDPGYLEKYYFTPGDTDYPVFRTSLLDVAVPTCWDQWFPEPARIYGLKGADLIVYPSAIGTLPGDPYDDAVDTWRVAMRGHAVCNALYVAAVNRVGDEDGMTFYGHTFVAQPDGQRDRRGGRGRAGPARPSRRRAHRPHAHAVALLPRPPAGDVPRPAPAGGRGRGAARGVTAPASRPRRLE